MTSSPLDELFNADGGGDFLSAEDLGGLPSVDLLFDVTKAESTNSQAGDPMLKLTMKVADGPLKNKTQMARYTWKAGGSEAGKSIVWRSLQSLGITREFAQQIAEGMPPQSQIPQLFIESAKRINALKPRVKANVSAQGGSGQYADRVQVNFDLKPAPQVNVTPAAPPAPEPAAAIPGAGMTPDQIAALQAQLEAAQAAQAVEAPAPTGVTVGGSAPNF